MPTITSIKPQKNKRRVNIYLDDKFGFGLDLETFVKLGLKVEQNFSDKEVEDLLKESELQKTYAKILRFASLRPRSEREYSNWLKKYKVHEGLKKELFSRLKRLDLLDDRRFAVWWIEQRTEFRPKSKRVLKSELGLKGIDRQIIEDVLEEAKIDEMVLAEKLVEKKMYLWQRLSPYDSRIKMSQYLARRGFGWATIEKLLRKLKD